MSGTHLHGVRDRSNMYSNDGLTAIILSASSGWRQGRRQAFREGRRERVGVCGGRGRFIRNPAITQLLTIILNQHSGLESKFPLKPRLWWRGWREKGMWG